jgi:hypothetical protein
MLRIILPIGLITALLLGSYMVGMTPIYFYKKSIIKGMDNRYLTLRKLPKPFYRPVMFSPEKMEGVNYENEEKWKELHFGPLLLPFPFKHPLYYVVPELDYKNQKTVLGFNILDPQSKVLNKVVIEGSQERDFSTAGNKVFQFPFFKKYLFGMNTEKIWKDIFSHPVVIKDHLKEASLLDTLQFWKKDYSPMIYDLYLLYNRDRYFSKKTLEVSYWSDRGFGVLEERGDEEKITMTIEYIKEKIYYPSEGKDIVLTLKTLKGDFTAEAYRRRFLRSLEYRKSESDSSIPLYAQFKSLSYKEKLDHRGLIFLLAAWTHNPDKQAYLQEMILFLERGKVEKKHIIPIYNFAFKRWKTNFSTIKKRLKESAQRKLDRKLKEIDESNRSTERNRKIYAPDENFENEQERIRYFLQQAKDSGKDTDNEEKQLIIE